MKARIRVTRIYTFEIDPWDHPEATSWSGALNEIYESDRFLDWDADSEASTELLGDPATEPWPREGG